MKRGLGKHYRSRKKSLAQRKRPGEANPVSGNGIAGDAYGIGEGASAKGRNGVYPQMVITRQDEARQGEVLSG